MKQVALPGVLLLWLSFLHAQTTTPFTLFFDFDQYELSPQGRQVLDQVIDQARAAADFSIEVDAHTDDRGADAYNERLAGRRAQTVQEYLAGRGLAVEKTNAASFGERRPAYTNGDDAGRQGNRRVELRLTTWRYESVEAVFNRLQGDKRQYYTIDSRRHVRLTGQQGALVYLPAGSLVFADGSTPEGPVQIELQEAYQLGDMLAMGLHTRSGGRLLESGGMIYLSATAAGRPLDVAEGRSLIMAMPAGQPVEGMQLFQGTVDARGQLTDWEATGQAFSVDLATVALELPPYPPHPYTPLSVPAFKLNLSGEPQAPAPPRAPIRPHEPRRESFRYRPGFLKRILTGKQQLQQVEEQRYQKALTAYQEKLARFEQQLPEYEQAKLRHAGELDAYRQAHTAWEAGLDAQRLKWQESPVYQAALQRRDQRHALAMERWRQEVAEWTALREERLAALEAQYDEVGRIDASSLNRYFYQVNKLGWINCDRFWEVPEMEKAALMIADDDDAGERVFVVFEGMNSIVDATRQDQHYRTSALPKSAMVKVVSLKVREGQAHLAVRRLQVGAFEGKEVALTYQPCKLGDIRRELAGL